MVRRHLQRAQRLALAGLVLALTAACAAPIGVKRSSARAVDRALSTNILSTDRLSVDTQNLLRQRGLDHIAWSVEVADILGAEVICGPLHSALGVFSGQGPTEAEP